MTVMTHWLYRQYGPRCAVPECSQPVDGTCRRCGAGLCYDHLCSHKLRKRDHGEPPAAVKQSKA